MASITIKNIDRLNYKFNNLANLDVKKVVIDATKIVHAQAKELAPVDSGNLKGSIHFDVKSKSEGVEGRVYTNLQYAPYVEFGTGKKGNGTYKYKIKGISLAYRNTSWTYTPDGGETFYRTNGQVAQPFMYPALKNNEKYIKSLFKTKIQDKIAKLCGGG